MREPLLDDSFSRPARVPEVDKPVRVGRRQFLRTVGLAGAILALSPRHILAQDNEIERWRDRVSGFVYTVFESGSRAKAINSRINSASLDRAPTTQDFHYYYSAPFVFVSMKVSPEQVICGNGFEINRLPFYDVSCPCESTTDLNAFEIRRITNASEIQYYSCVLAPASRREPLQYADHSDYRRTVSNYGLNPDEYRPEYKRVFTGKGRAYCGYQIADKTRLGPNSKPLGDLLLSAEEI